MFRTSVSDHGLHVIAVVMIAVSVLALLITLIDRPLMAEARAGQGRRASEPARQPAGERKN